MRPQPNADSLKNALKRSGLNVDAAPPRFQQSLEIIAARKTIYVQQPRVYFYPGLPQVQFFERDQFDWVAELESRTGAILNELRALLASPRAFAPHIGAAGRDQATGHQSMAGNADWSSFNLWENGAPVAENARRCPLTMAALAKVPLSHFSRTSPSAPAVMFSMLRAGARIPPHTGCTNVRLICHLPLVVPAGCGFRVGNEVRQWEVGKVLIFDDTIEHEAWNESNEDRVVLIFDVWRPELSESEKQAITALFRHREAVAAPRR